MNCSWGAVTGVWCQHSFIIMENQNSSLPPSPPLSLSSSAVTDNGRNIKGNQQQPAAPWAFLARLLDKTCLMHTACFLHEFISPHTAGFMLNADDWRCVCAWKDWHSTNWLSLSARDLRDPGQSPVGRLGSKNTLTRARACMKQLFVFLSRSLSVEENQWSFRGWCLPLSVTSGSVVPYLNEHKPDCFHSRPPSLVFTTWILWCLRCMQEGGHPLIYCRCPSEPPQFEETGCLFPLSGVSTWFFTQIRTRSIVVFLCETSCQALLVTGLLTNFWLYFLFLMYYSPRCHSYIENISTF